MGEFPTSVPDGEALEDKRTPNPPPSKSSRDPPEGNHSLAWMKLTYLLSFSPEEYRCEGGSPPRYYGVRGE